MTHEATLSPHAQRLAAFPNQLQVRAEQQTKYKRIVVPVEISADDNAAISLAMSLASVHGAELTLLHFVSESIQRPAVVDPPRVSRCLDAFDNLHGALTPMAQTESPADPRRGKEEARAKLQEVLECQFPQALRSTINLHIECQFGDFTRDVVPYCNAKSADLLIITSRLSWWGLPVVPARIRKILRNAKSPIFIVQPARITTTNDRTQ